MASAHDVAAYVLGKCGSMSAMKLQKLLYYSQAWHLVWDGEPLFGERIEAWANGPVVPAIYTRHRGEFTVAAWPWGKGDNLSASEAESVDAVLEYYGGKSAVWLSELTHREDPWLNARKGLSPGDRGKQVITHFAMADYYERFVGADG